MEQIPKPKALIFPFLLLLLVFLNHTWLVHSRNLPSSPSPAPAPESIGPATYEGRKENPNPNRSWGSFPATCHSKCNQCRPCVPVEVSIRTMAAEENQYYPIAWKCMCQSNIFSP